MQITCHIYGDIGFFYYYDESVFCNEDGDDIFCDDQSDCIFYDDDDGIFYDEQRLYLDR